VARESLSTHAILLRSVPYRDADLILTLYTDARGRLSALARSARRSHKRFGACLQLFTVSTMHLSSRGGDLWTLASAELDESFAGLAADMVCFAHASYATELVRELTAAEQPDEHLLALIVELYRRLHGQGPSLPMLRAFELVLLELLGLAPVLDRCVGCGSADVDGRGMVLDPSRGGVCCERCAALSRSPGVRPLSGAARQVLAAIQGAPSLGKARDLVFAPEPAAEARDALLALILNHVGKPLRSLEFIAKVSGAARQLRADS
jgi:DNA repair protein RecO (recombination protein O)